MGFTALAWAAAVYCAILPAGSLAVRQAAIAALPAADAIRRNVADLHPAFVYSPKRIDTAIKRGQRMAKEGKSAEDAAGINAQRPRGVKGEKGRSHESLVICKSLDAVDWVTRSYEAAAAYEPLAADENVLRVGTYAETMEFEVSLVSIPRARWAAEGDVNVEKFVLTDDQGRIIKPLETVTVSPVYQGTVTHSGVTAVSETVEGVAVALATTTNTTTTDGTTTTSTTTGEQKSTYTRTEYKPWTADYPYYSAKYSVKFPLFDAAGQPHVTRNTRKLTLHILTGTGERVVKYKLSTPKE